LHVRLELLGRQETFQPVVEPNRTAARIGAIVLETLDLVVDCRTQTLHPRDPDRIITEIERPDRRRPGPPMRHRRGSLS